MIEALIVVPAPTLTPSSSTEHSTRAPSPIVTPSPSALRSPTSARAPIEQPGATRAGATTRPSTVAPSARISPAACSRPTDLGRHLALEDVVGRPADSLRRADVEPVAALLVSVQAPIDERREHIALYRDVRPRGRHAVEHASIEDVSARVDQVGAGLLRTRLLDELGHRAIRSHAHEPIGRRVGDRHQPERRARSRALMRRELRGEIKIGENVAVEHEEPLVEQILGELQRPARAERARLLEVPQVDPERGAVAQHALNAIRHEPAPQNHVIDAMAAEPLEHVRDERAPHQRDHRLGDRRGQRTQAGAFTAREDQRLHVTFPLCRRSTTDAFVDEARRPDRVGIDESCDRRSRGCRASARRPLASRARRTRAIR